MVARILSVGVFLLLLCLCVFMGSIKPQEHVTWAQVGVEDSRILFQRPGDWNIYQVNPDGTGEVALTHHAQNDVDAEWSPDGTQFVFVSRRYGNTEICLVEATGENEDGSNVVRLTTNGAVDYHPSWSPDGTQIVFSSTRDGNTELYIMDVADGSNVSRIYDFPSTWVAYEADWSPDGELIAFTLIDDSGSSDIYTIRPNGSDLQNITNSEGVNDRRPAWSPDGSMLAFSSYRNINWDVYALVVQSGVYTDEVRLTTALRYDIDPTWSPDGNWIIFESLRWDESNTQLITGLYMREVSDIRNPGPVLLVIENAYGDFAWYGNVLPTATPTDTSTSTATNTPTSTATNTPTSTSTYTVTATPTIGITFTSTVTVSSVVPITMTSTSASNTHTPMSTQLPFVSPTQGNTQVVLSPSPSPSPSPVISVPSSTQASLNPTVRPDIPLQDGAQASVDYQHLGEVVVITTTVDIWNAGQRDIPQESLTIDFSSNKPMTLTYVMPDFEYQQVSEVHWELGLLRVGDTDTVEVVWEIDLLSDAVCNFAFSARGVTALGSYVNADITWDNPQCSGDVIVDDNTQEDPPIRQRLYLPIVIS